MSLEQPKWHILHVDVDFDRTLKSTALADKKTQASSGGAAFCLIQLNKLMRQNRDNVWNHSLDGECLLHIEKLGLWIRCKTSAIVCLFWWQFGCRVFCPRCLHHMNSVPSPKRIGERSQLAIIILKVIRATLRLQGGPPYQLQYTREITL